MKIATLIAKKLEGTISEKEERTLNAWLKKSKDNKQLYARLKVNHDKGISITELSNLDAKQAWQNILEQTKSRNVPKHNFFNKRKRLQLAAIFMLLISLAFSSYSWYANDNLEKETHQNAITLELENGEIQLLHPNDVHTITDKEGNVLGRKTGNKLAYKNTKYPEKLVFNTLKIPNGKTFEITLSDGTLVHLNAGSSLRYPIHFLKEHDRTVFLQGEAFFDVKTDKKRPFKVKVADMNVSVLGTKFNISAYEEDAAINTVLVEGLVSLSYSKNDQSNKESVILKPNHKAAWNTQTKINTIQKVDTKPYTSWIHGRMVIRNLPFSKILKKLERRYNVIIKNEFTELNHQMFTASFDVETIEEVLNSFSENVAFKFNRKKNLITIVKP